MKPGLNLAGAVDDGGAVGRADCATDTFDFAVAEENVTDRVEIARRIEEAAALQQNIGHVFTIADSASPGALPERR
jgi:hypothetical protein